MSYLEADNYPLEDGRTDDLSVETDADMTHLAQPFNDKPAENEKTLCDKVQQCQTAHDEQELKRIYI